MYIAHLDLKLKNILVKIVESKIMNKIIQHAIVKVIDFGMSKMEVGRNSKTIEHNYIYDSPKYMAPETLKNRFQTIAMCPFEAHVYSFVIIWILERIEKGERPKLPSNCDNFIELIKEYWRLNPLHRPKFASICKRLNLLKYNFLVGMNVPNAPYFGVSKKNYYQNEDLQQILYQLRKIRLVQKIIEKECINEMKVLCLVGMGGIGKTTITKAILVDIKDIYNALCFVECMESGVDCFTTSCNILEQFKIKSQSSDLKEAQEMLKSFLAKNKTILVFDNVKNQSQIEDVLIDDIFASNGSTLVATTQDSKAIEHCGKKSCKINIKELDEETRMKFFITHSCGQENLSNELVEVGKKIVRLKRGRELDRDENNSNYKIWKLLRVSFDNLKDRKKKMFLDICCFFCSDVSPQGMLKERTLQMWDNNQKRIFKQDIEVMLDTLIYQSLIKLQDMGRNIVEKEMEYKYTRMWNLNVDQFHGLSNKIFSHNYYSNGMYKTNNSIKKE
uniref:Protein kinase domain-containing protein n=1 Tax=Physcomitrium patens TaxID=3218 RepID=A0A7I4C3R7_PHYPA